MALGTGTLDTGDWAPVREERDDTTLPIKGELPRELRGTLFRNGPNPQFDHARCTTGSSATACCTPSRSTTAGPATATAGCARRSSWPSTTPAAPLFGTGFGGQKCATHRPTAVTDGGVANTNIVWHAGKLLALEEAPPADRDRSRDARRRKRLSRTTARHRRPLHRPSQDRSRHRRDDLLRLLRRRPASPRA